MTKKEEYGQLFSVGLYGKEKLTDQDKEVLEEIRPGSVIFFSRNIGSPLEFAGLIREIEEFLGYKPCMTIDQEGGLVTRLQDGFSVSPGARAAGEAVRESRDPSLIFRMARIMAEEMKAVGLDWNLAPVVDINNNPHNPGIGIRSFAEEPREVVRSAELFLQGMKAGGILCCLKHFPGKGRITKDAHITMPELDIPAEQIREEELLPFRELDADSWMPSHVYCPALQSIKEPATLSREILRSRPALGRKSPSL